MKILLILLFIPFVAVSQIIKPFNPDADDYYCTNNYEWFYDTSYSRRSIKIDLDAVDFMEWVFKGWNRIPKGVTIFEKGKTYKEDTWFRRGEPKKKIGDTSVLYRRYIWEWYTPKTAKELWLEWYKLINECWWE